MNCLVVSTVITGGADVARTPIYAELRPKGPGGISPSDEFIWVRAPCIHPFLIFKVTILILAERYDSDIIACGWWHACLVVCALQGMSWVNLAPVPAYQIAISARSQHPAPPPSLPPPLPLPVSTHSTGTTTSIDIGTGTDTVTVTDQDTGRATGVRASSGTAGSTVVLSALATALDPARMDATMLAYRRQGFFVWEKLNGTHECAPGNNSARCACCYNLVAAAFLSCSLSTLFPWSRQHRFWFE